jgi:hypothetical protein
MPLELIGQDGFEQGFYMADDPYTGELQNSHLTIPKEWLVDWVQDMNDNVRPEWKPKDKQMGHPEVYEDGGRYAAGVHHSTVKYQTVLYRHVDAVVGARYRFEAQMMGKSGARSGFSLAIGIDPFGGTDWGSSDVKWHWYTRDMKLIWKEGTWYNNVSPIIEAKSTRITLYLRAWCRFADSASAIFDNTRLYSDAEQTPEPPDPPKPPPTNGVDYDRIRDIVREELDGKRAWWDAKIGGILDGLADLWEKS